MRASPGTTVTWDGISYELLYETNERWVYLLADRVCLHRPDALQGIVEHLKQFGRVDWNQDLDRMAWVITLWKPGIIP